MSLSSQTTAAEHIVGLFGSLDDIGEALFLQGPPQEDTTIVSDNVAIVVMRPDCELRNQSIKISSNSLDSNSDSGESSLVLPVSVFGDDIQEDCGQLGVIAVVYGGSAPELISLQDDFIPKPNCTVGPPPKAHGRWLVH